MVRLEPHDIHHLAHALAPFGAVADPVDAQALADAVADGRARIERCIRILEDDLHPPAVVAQRRAAQLRDVVPIEHDLAGGRLDEAEQEPSDGRLSASGLADEPKGLATHDPEVDAIDGLDLGDGTLKDAALDREPLDQVAQFDEWFCVRVSNAPGHRPDIGGQACDGHRAAAMPGTSAASGYASIDGRGLPSTV